VRATHHGVDRFFFVPGRDPGRVVDVVAVAWIKPHAVYVNGAMRHLDFVLRRIHEFVSLPEVVALRGLIKHVGDHAITFGAKRVVGGDVRKATGIERANVG
tara:strand:- start:392 stop:694 length:303 start_codon:yes stop_codon:yes gene_type:complete